MNNHQTSTKVARVKNAVAAGTDDTQVSVSVDMLGFESVEFLVAFGAITSTAVTTVKAQQSSDDGSSDTFADLAGTAISVADDDDNGIVRLEIHNPVERYVRCAVVRATANVVIDSTVAVQTGPKNEPVTQDATVVGNELSHAPAEGTA